MTWRLKSRAVTPRATHGERRRRFVLSVLDVLESRQLLAANAYSFVPPDLSPFLHQANPTPGIDNRLIGALQAQINNGPLADLKDPKGDTTLPKITGPQYVAAVETMVQGVEGTALQVQPNNRQLNQLVQLQGDSLVAQTVALDALANAGVIQNAAAAAANPKVLPGNTSEYWNSNLTTINHLTLSRPLWPYGTPLLNIINRTEAFEADLNTLVKDIPTTITIGTAATLAQDEAAAFTADIHLATVQKPALRTSLDQQVQTLIAAINTAAQAGPSGIGDFQNAIMGFKTATYDQSTGAGYLGPQGGYGHNRPQPTNGSQLPAGVPLPAFTDANSFALGRYKPMTANSDIVYHRNYGGNVGMFGRYVSTALYPNPQVAIRRSALDQTFSSTNNAFYVTDATVPKTILRYVGKVAPIYQGVLTPRNSLYPGLGSQILLSTTFAPVQFSNSRVTGT